MYTKKQHWTTFCYPAPIILKIGFMPAVSRGTKPSNPSVLYAIPVEISIVSEKNGGVNLL